MGGLHAGIDASFGNRRRLQGSFERIKSILIEVGAAAFSHGGFEIERPIEPITAQMSLRYSVAVALLDEEALLRQFATDRINADDVWALIHKTKVREETSFDEKPHTGYTTRVTVTMEDGSKLQQLVELPKGEPMILSPIERSPTNLRICVQV